LTDNSIELVSEGDRWAVVIVEDAKEYRQIFLVKEHAQTWMTGQRIRLGLHPTGASDNAGSE
jgi:hypothetical protein